MVEKFLNLIFDSVRRMFPDESFIRNYVSRVHKHSLPFIKEHPTLITFECIKVKPIKMYHTEVSQYSVLDLLDSKVRCAQKLGTT